MMLIVKGEECEGKTREKGERVRRSLYIESERNKEDRLSVSQSVPEDHFDQR